MTFLAAIALLLPGFSWWAWLGKRDQDPLVSLAQITGVSIALVSLLAEFVFLLGGRFSTTTLLMLLSACAVLAVLGMIKHGAKLRKKYRRHLWIGLLLLGVLIAWRLFQARNLLLPNWVDSQHHFLIIRLILEQGGLPGDLSPYLPVPFYYHFGFHAAAALFTALSELEIGQAMLIFGQILNAFIGLSIYTLGKALFRDWRPAAAAALLAGFATRMPAYYLSWGRYTLTTGLILLPLAMALALTILRKTRRKKEILTLAILVAGVLLSHYFTAVLLAIFLLLLAMVHLIPRWDRPLTALIHFSWVPAAAVLGLVLAGPWLLRVTRFSSANTGVGVSLPASPGAVFENSQWDYIRNLLGPASDHWLLLTAFVGLLLALVLRKSIGFALWSLLLAVMALPLGLTLGPFRPDHFAIVLFLPAVLWLGWLSWQIGCWLGKHLKKSWLSTLLPLLVVVSWSAWNFPLSADIVNPVTVLVTEQDMAALDWVKENTPADARFFINTAYWLNNTYRGVDGGGWLLPYTGRWSLVPTVFYGFSTDRASMLQVRGWGQSASLITTCSEDFWALAAAADLDWLYIREGVGSLQPEGLEGCQGITQVYTNEKVSVYKINQ